VRQRFASTGDLWRPLLVGRTKRVDLAPYL